MGCAVPGAALPQASLARRRWAAWAAQVIGSVGGIGVAVIGGTVVYGVLKMTVGIRLDPEAEFNGADLSIHKVSVLLLKTKPAGKTTV